jgi:hypothetical protein
MFDFTWKVPTHGFHWIEAGARDMVTGELVLDRYLTPRLTLTWREYDLGRDAPALFYEFGEMEPVEDAVQAFANAYGALGIGSIVTLSDGTQSRGENLRVWQQEIIAMRHALRIWQALRNQMEQKLRTWFHVDTHGDESTVLYTPDEPWPQDVSTHYSHSVMRASPADPVRFMPEDLHWGSSDVSRIDETTNAMTLALAVLRMLVGVRLMINGNISFEYRQDMQRPVPLALKIFMPSLVSALWLQLATAIEEDQRYQRCPQCQCWFLVAAKARRASTTYCSPRCRIKAFRERHEQTPGTRGPSPTVKRGSQAGSAKEWSWKPESTGLPRPPTNPYIGWDVTHTEEDTTERSHP